MCFDGPRNALVVPCGHVFLCYECAGAVCAAGQPCPVCRGPIQQVFKMFYA